jgi:hypothetical protein
MNCWFGVTMAMVHEACYGSQEGFVKKIEKLLREGSSTPK